MNVTGLSGQVWAEVWAEVWAAAGVISAAEEKSAETIAA
jgi:hypothetical protein